MTLNSSYRTVRQVLADLLALRQTNRLLRIDFPRAGPPAGTLLVINRLHAVESMSKDYGYTLELLSDRPDLPLDQLLGVMVTVSLIRDDGSIRYFSGHVFSFRFVKNDSGFCFYEMTLRPWLAFLRYRRNCRLFNGLEVRTQASEIFARYPVADWQVGTVDNDCRMTDACQFDESDYNYVHRRFESRGWHYRYSHRKDGHTLHIGGDSYECPPIDGNGKSTWRGSRSGVRSGGITAFGASRSVGPTSYHTSSFDFKTCNRVPVDQSSASAADQLPDLGVYEYAGAYGYKDRVDGESFAQLRMQELDCKTEQFHGAGDDDRIEAGRTFELEDTSNELGTTGDNSDREYLILEAVHVISNNYEVAVSSESERVSEYKNTFVCVRRKKVWRPGRGYNSVDTKIHGVQTATVVGLPNEEIFTDEYGRVLVEFHWGYEGEQSRRSGWLRVASGWAGPGYGQFSVPRTGDEVMVLCQDSNPDRFIIIGRVFNGVNVPTRFNNRGDLPGQRYLSGIRSKEVNGGGYNQLRLDDTPQQLSAQVMSSHAQSQLNLGFLTHPREDGSGRPRGSGIELATNDSVSIRAAKGLLISAWERLDASGNQLSCDEHVALMQTCVDLFRTLGNVAVENSGAPIDPSGQQALQAAVGQLSGASPQPGQAVDAPPIVALGAPDGISFASQKSIVNYAGLNLDSAASHHIQYTAGKAFTVNAGDGLSLFAKQKGIRLIAHYGKFVMQSQHDEIAINAAKDMVLTSSDGVIKLMAKELHLIAEDGSFIKVGGGIQAGTKSTIQLKASKKELDGPATMHATLPHFAGDGKAPPHWIALHYLDPDTGEDIAGADYEIHMDGGPTITGTLDANGKARHDNVLNKPVKKVIYKARPGKGEQLADPLDALLDSNP